VKLFFDFDGTLVDAMKRDYHAFCISSRSKIDYEEYLYRRRKREKIQDLIPAGTDFNSFIETRSSIIESIDLLSLDEVLPCVIEFLEVASENDCHILSARKSEKDLIDQCTRLGISRYFKSISAVDNPVKKGESIERISFGSPCVMFGDTEYDIAAAKQSFAVSVAVSTGIRDFEILRAESPDFLVENLGSLLTGNPSIYSGLEKQSLWYMESRKR